MKKLISVVLALIMIAALPVMSFAADTVTIYFDNTQGWESVKVHYWGDVSTTWPGIDMTLVEGSIYCVEIPTVPGMLDGLMFHDGMNHDQTADLLLPTDGKNLYTYNTETWSVYSGTPSESITVNGTYVSGTQKEPKISVDVVWEAMEFTYYGPSDGTWNPATHTYEGATDGGWSTNTPAITVTNHSNVAVTAALDFTAESTGSGIIGTFTEASGTVNDNILELATAEGTEVSEAPSATAGFGISGAAIDANQKLGTITVTIMRK